LLHGVAWSIVQRMMIDASSFDDTDGDVNEIELSESNQEQILNYVNSLL